MTRQVANAQSRAKRDARPGTRKPARPSQRAPATSRTARWRASWRRRWLDLRGAEDREERVAICRESYNISAQSSERIIAVRFPFFFASVSCFQCKMGTSLHRVQPSFSHHFFSRASLIQREQQCYRFLISRASTRENTQRRCFYSSFVFISAVHSSSSIAVGVSISFSV